MEKSLSEYTLEDLENCVWEDSSFDSHLVQQCTRLRKKPINSFTSEDLRICISRGVGLPHLVPLALRKLSNNVWESGDYYDGCLLLTIPNIDSDFWQNNSNLLYELKEIMTTLFSQIETFHNSILPAWEHIENLKLE